ncbi:Glutathione S-transferase 1, partial [Aphelenchoides avenae]
MPIRTTKYRLYYGDLRGLGEPARMILHYVNEPFDDVRLSMEGFAETKKKFPFQKMPVLEVDGKYLPESFAIYRYLGRKFGLSGRNSFEEAHVDAYADWFKDFNHEISPFLRAAAGFGEDDK